MRCSHATWQAAASGCYRSTLPPRDGSIRLRAGVFLAFGSGDFGARIIAAVFGLVLIAVAFAMRRQLGRAGALAFATMLTLSPTITWFSRSTSATIPAIAMVLLAIALVFALIGASDTLKVAGLAIAIALALTADPMVFPIAAIFVAILILMGLYELIFRRNSMIRLRVWWERRSAHLIFGVAIAIGVFVAFESALGRRNLDAADRLFGAMQRMAAGAASGAARAASIFIFPPSHFMSSRSRFSVCSACSLFSRCSSARESRRSPSCGRFFRSAFFLADPVRQPGLAGDDDRARRA